MDGKEVIETVQDIKKEIVSDLIRIDKSYSMNVIAIIIIVIINLVFLMAILLIIF